MTEWELTQQTDTTDSMAEKNLWPCLLSFLVSGLGQLVQGRKEAFIGHFSLFLVWLVCCYLTGMLALIAAVPLLFSPLDAAFWTGDKKSYHTIRIQRIGVYLFVPVCVVVFLVPAVIAAREAARRMQCVCHLKGLALAFYNYHDAYGSFPPAYTVDATGKPLHSWRVLILPFYNEEKLYEKIRLDEPWDSEYNRQFHSIDITVFQCPSGRASTLLSKRFPHLRSKGKSYYSVVIGEQTPFPGAKATKLSDITDGTSNTILLVERLFPVCWMDPNHEISFNTAIAGANREHLGIGSFHSGIFNAALCDGSILTFSEDIEPERLKAYLTSSGGEEVPPPWEENQQSR